MRRWLWRVPVSLALAAGLVVTTAAQDGRLSIVIIAGEDAINVIQQKTAVAPIVEVRDRNGQPVAGAVVTFAVRGGRASFDGARTLSVTTGAAGRATGTGLVSTDRGAFRISASTTVAGQTATAIIRETNVLTAGTAAATGSAAAGTGGGLSGIAIAAIAAGVAGGTIVGVKAATSGMKAVTYSSPFATQFALVTAGTNSQGAYGCQSTRDVSGTVKLELTDNGSSVSGRAEVTATETEIARTISEFCGGLVGTTGWTFTPSITGTAATVAFSDQTSSGGNNSGATTNQTQNVAFTGALSNNVVTGTITYSVLLVGQGPGHSWTETASMTLPLTLR
jgi:hypothetical protein